MANNFLDKTGLSYFWSKINSKFLKLTGGGAASMGDTLGTGPYTIEFTEEDDDELSAEHMNYDNSTSGLLATTVQGAIDEVHTAVQPIAKGGTGVSDMIGNDYTANRPRGIILQNTEPDSVPNGCIVGVYE